MSRKKTQKAVTWTAVTIATVLAWISGYIVMHIIYDSVAAGIVFGTVWAIIVCCESRFSYISLKSDGRIAITKEEVKSNLWQIFAATLVAILVTIPLELMLFKTSITDKVGAQASDLGLQLRGLAEIFNTSWLPMVLLCLLVIVIYQAPIFVRMASDD